MRLDKTDVSGNVALFTSAHLADFNILMCREIKKITKKKVILYTNSLSSVNKHLKFVKDGSIDEVIDCELKFRSGVNKTVPENYVETAEYYEKNLGVNYNKIFMTKRNAGRGFSLGGLYHPHNKFSKNVSYEQLVHSQSEEFSFWIDQIKQHKISLFLNGTFAMETICKYMNVNFRTMYSARIDNYYYWAESTKVEPPNLKQAFDALDEGCDNVDEAVDIYFHELESRKEFKTRENPVLRFVKMSWRALLNHSYLMYKGYLTEQTYYLTDLISFHWRYSKVRRYLIGPKSKKLTDLKDTPFVYFPLQAEPEFSLQVMSQECFCQLGVIASIARDLPVGVTLAVKDSPWAIGRRPSDFYKQLLEFKNVVILNLDEEGVDAIKQCEAVCTITGSGGIEGARIGKPVIVFGRHNGYDFLPHVQKVVKEEELEPALKNIFDGNIDTSAARINGGLYSAALRAISFDCGNVTAFKQDTANKLQAEIAIKNLLNGI